jgi:pheromone shutdown protein TraB
MEQDRVLARSLEENTVTTTVTVVVVGGGGAAGVVEYMISESVKLSPSTRTSFDESRARWQDTKMHFMTLSTNSRQMPRKYVKLSHDHYIA